MTRWLTGLRFAYGTALLVLPSRALARLTRAPVDRRAAGVARVLGARELAQAELTRRWPTRQVLLAGAGVDVLHAASMAGLAAADRGRRRLALHNAASALLLAVGSLLAARARRRSVTPPA
jgi:hypothetical protein